MYLVNNDASGSASKVNFVNRRGDDWHYVKMLVVCPSVEDGSWYQRIPVPRTAAGKADLFLSAERAVPGHGALIQMTAFL